MVPAPGEVTTEMEGGDTAISAPGKFICEPGTRMVVDSRAAPQGGERSRVEGYCEVSFPATMLRPQQP